VTVVTADEVDVSATTGTTSAALNVSGSTAAGELSYMEQDGNTDHVLTLNQTGDGSSQAALNAVSANPNFSCVEVTGTETNRGTIKVTHQGYSNGSDSSAAGLSIDLQTTNGGTTGTNAQGIFITSTTDSIPGGDAICIRYDSQDWFAVKGNVGAGNGIVGIGVATGHTPAGMLEIAQKDTTTVGFYMEAEASGADMIDLKDSSGNLRFQVTNAGNLVTRATALISTNMQVGSTSSNIGGGGNGCIGISQVSTAPSTNPSSKGVVLYVDSNGNLLCRTSAGNVRTVAAV
jgi:Hyaluronidase protein (HylP)